MDAAYVCPVCHGQLRHQSTSGNNSLHCHGCSAGFPLIGETVPVFLTDAKRAFSTTFAEMGKTRKSALGQIADLDVAIKTERWRAETLVRRRTAIEENLKLLDTVRTMIARTVNLTPEDVADHSEDGDAGQGYQSFFKTLRYLERDRCGSEGGEAEVETIMATVRRQILENCPSRETCLVLGAGIGRFGEAVTDLFSRVYSVDVSPIMLALQCLLRQEESITFYRTSVKTVRSREDCHKKFEARLTGAPSSNEFSFVGDTTQLPLPASSIDVIVSIYFTDAMIPERYIGELKRVLKPGGAFVHFGPNGWHFVDVARELTLDELKEQFVRWGFAVGSEEWVPATHLKDDRSVHTSSFVNYSFVATMREEEEEEPVLLHSRLSIAGAVKLVEEHFLKETGEGETACAIATLTNEQYKVSTYVAEFLKRVRPDRSVGEIINELSEEYEIDEGSSSKILAMIEQLVRKGVLNVADPS